MRHRRVRVPLATLSAIALFAVGCGGGEQSDEAGRLGPGGVRGDTTTTAIDGGPTTTNPAPTTTPPPPLADVPVRLTTLELRADAPVDLVQRPGSNRMWLAERPGLVTELVPEGDELARPAQPQLDIRDLVGSTASERGLLGLAFHPDGDRLYVSYTRGTDGASTVDEFNVVDGPQGAAVDADSRRTLITVAQPYGNHNGGGLVTGPDGMLYLGLGDGGSSGDPEGNGQDPTTLLGSVLRIDPDGSPYGIPADNPFTDDQGAPEIWLWGARNPWRFAFDRATGDLWVADVGQNRWEEVNHLPADGNGRNAGRGVNLGWNVREGFETFSEETEPAGQLTDPVFVYGRDGGCSITGGVVVRGTHLPELDGAYLYADFCTEMVGALRVEGTEVTDEHRWELPTGQAVAFGMDEAGVVYLLSLDGAVHRLDVG